MSRSYAEPADFDSVDGAPVHLVWMFAGPDGGRQIMGVRHRQHMLEGWQFHPESFLTEPGKELLTRFLNWKSPALT